MGIETDAAGNRFEGLFQHGDFKRGRVVYSNGDIYQGDILDDCKHGSGVLMRYCTVLVGNLPLALTHHTHDILPPCLLACHQVL